MPIRRALARVVLPGLLSGCCSEEVCTAAVWAADAEPESGTVFIAAAGNVPLTADYYLASRPERPAIVLIHGGDPQGRYGWPAVLVESLHAANWSILVPDMRGVGDSGGEPMTAMDTLDVGTLVSKVLDDGASSVAILATESYCGPMIAWTFRAFTDDLGPVPAALGFACPHPLIEAHVGVSMDQLPALPAIFVSDPLENAFIEAQLAADQEGWVFHEYETSCFMSDMLAEPALGMDLVAFYQSLWPE